MWKSATTLQRAAFWQGLRDAVAVAPAYLSFGLVCGVAAVNAGLSTGAARESLDDSASIMQFVGMTQQDPELAIFP